MISFGKITKRSLTGVKENIMKKIFMPILACLLVYSFLSIIFGTQQPASIPTINPVILDTAEILKVTEIKPIKVIDMQMTKASYAQLDETEMLIFATLVAYECGGSSYETKLAVASVIINRMKIWNLSLRDVVYAKNQFSPASLINKRTGANYYWHNGKRCTKNMSRGGPYEQCWQAVEEVCANGPTIPTYVIYFRSGHYHNWSTVVNYAKIGPMYFSYAPKYTKICLHCGERFTKTEFSVHQNNCM